MKSGVTPAWTLIIVPPTPTASPRRVGVKMRTVRWIGIIVLGLVVAPWAWTLTASVATEHMADLLASEQRLSMALQDSVVSLRAASLATLAQKLPPVGMQMPVNGEITSRFSRSRFHPILEVFRAHLGVDLAAPAGTRIRAPAAGTVVSVGRQLGFGLIIEMAHSGGIATRYAHCRSALVQAGDTVSMGQAIGVVGESGLATAPHLHFEVLVHGTAVDPIKFIASTHLLTLPTGP
jgi:murein DD-endopeptidase MepM/ murein hydrolase activator NlpD